MNVSEITIPVPWGHIAATSRGSEGARSKQNQEITDEADKEESNRKDDQTTGEKVGNMAEHKTPKQSNVSDNPFLSNFNLEPNSSPVKSPHKEIQMSGKKMKECNLDRPHSPIPSPVALKQTPLVKTSPVKSKSNIEDKVLNKKSSINRIQNKIKKKSRNANRMKSKKNPKGRDTQYEATEENTDFLRTYNIVKIQNPKLLASRAAKLNLVKQTLLNIESEKNAKASCKDKSEKRCDDCGTPLSSGRDFIMHRDRCEVRQKKLEKILSGLKLPRSLQTTPQKLESVHSISPTADKIIANLTDMLDSNEEDAQASAAETDNGMEVTPVKSRNRIQGVSSKSNKSPFRTLYNLYDGLNREHIDIILKASRNERTLRSRSQETDSKAEKCSKKFRKNFEVDNSQNEIIITTRIKGNVIERNTLIRPVQSETEEMVASGVDINVDEGQVNSKSMYETLKNSCQIPDATSCIEDDLEAESTQPRRELISDCPQGLPRSANIRKLLKRNVLNPIRRKGSILHESKKHRLERRNSLIGKAKTRSKKKVKLEKITSLLNELIENPNKKKSTIGKKKKAALERRKDFKTSWQVEETDQRQERALRITARNERRFEKKANEDTVETSGAHVESVEIAAPQAVKSSVIQAKEERRPDASNVFVPYDLVIVTPVQDKVHKTSNETISHSLSTMRTDVSITTPQTVNSASQSSEKSLQSTPKPRKAAEPTKRKTPSTPRSLEQILLKQEIMEELKKLESRKWCDVCKKPFANSSSLNLHFTSSAHKRRVESSLFGASQGGAQVRTGKVEKKSKMRSALKRERIEATPETSEEDEEVENMCCVDEEESYELSEDEKQEEIVVEKVKRGRPRLTLSTSSNIKQTRRSSSLALEETIAREDKPRENNESPQSGKTKTCATCNVSFLSDAQLNRHYSSKMHKTAAVLIADGKPKVCSVCKVAFSVNSQLHKHYATQTHKMAAAKLVDELEERGVIKTALFA